MKREKQLLQESSAYKAHRESKQREFLRKESKIYKTIYLEVTDMVQKYAEHFNYTLVMRFSRQGLDSSNNPKTIMQRMNRQVVYHREKDDITDAVLDVLNRNYNRSAGKGSRSPTTSQ